MCGIIGIISQRPVANELYDSLIHLQHRGQDAAGILTSDTRIHTKTGKGLVREIFQHQELNQLTGNLGIAHVRYPTTGTTDTNQIQPFWLSHPYGVSMAHNGNLINYQELANNLRIERRHHLNTDCDSEAILHLFADSLAPTTTTHTATAFFEHLCQSVSLLFSQLEGAYSIVSTLLGKGLIAFRDPHGIRPLVMGYRKNNHNCHDYIVASENTMFYSLGFTHAGSIKPGELVFIDEAGQLHRRVLLKKQFSPCIFEHVYFARPDAKLDDISIYRARLRMGQNLANKWKTTYPNCKPDIVIPAPFTSNTAALSFSNQLGVRYSEGLYKNPFIGRTFIMSNQDKRKSAVRYKLTPQETEIKDKRVLILDDSIVRGTTSKEIIAMVREYGAKSIYFVSACPPIKFPCFYGIDIPTQSELIASKLSIEEIRQYLGADILLYQSLNDLVEAVTSRGKHSIHRPCMACMDGQYICGNLSKSKIKELGIARKLEQQEN